VATAEVPRPPLRPGADSRYRSAARSRFARARRAAHQAWARRRKRREVVRMSRSSCTWSSALFLPGIVPGAGDMTVTAPKRFSGRAPARYLDGGFGGV